MHSSTITAFLLPLLLSSVLAVPIRVQNKGATQSGPPAAQVSLENGLLKAGQPPAAAWLEAGLPVGKRSLKGRQADLAEAYVAQGDTSPAALNPTAGETTEDLYNEQQMANAGYAQATGKDPAMCYESCGRSLEGGQDDPEAATTPTTDPN